MTQLKLNLFSLFHVSGLVCESLFPVCNQYAQKHEADILPQNKPVTLQETLQTDRRCDLGMYYSCAFTMR